MRPHVAMSEEPFFDEMYQTTSVGVAPLRTAAKLKVSNHSEAKPRDDRKLVEKRDMSQCLLFAVAERERERARVQTGTFYCTMTHAKNILDNYIKNVIIRSA